MKKQIYVLSVLVLAGALGCSDPAIERADTPPPVNELYPKLVNGRITNERPEVGTMFIDGGMCTATLVAGDVVITAAHCVNYTTRLQSANYGTFTIESAAGRKKYTISQYISFGGNLGQDDIALLKLAQPVPGSVARPVPLGRATPSVGSQLTAFGYGCTQRGGQTDGRKRKVIFNQGTASANLCPGDSGGPVFSNGDGAILRINSGYELGGFGTDVYGDVPVNFGRISAKVAQWSTSGGPVDPQGRRGPGDSNDPTVGLSTVCGFDHPVKQDWVCTSDGTMRSRCRKGHGPEYERCNGGCGAGVPGAGAQCQVRTSLPACGPTYESYQNWTCTADGRHILRCHQDRVELQRCGDPCSPGQVLGSADCTNG